MQSTSISNVHFHCVFLEGVYLDRIDQGLKPRFVKAEPPSDTDIAAVVQKISHRVCQAPPVRYLEPSLAAAVATGYAPCVTTLPSSPRPRRPPSSSVSPRGAGRSAGPAHRLRLWRRGRDATLTGPRCASVHGFSLYANTQVPAHRCDQLERLLRSTARGAVSLERLAQDANGDLVSTFTHPWSDGTTGIRLSPLELLEKWRPWCPYRASTWCAMRLFGATATCVRRSSRPRASRVDGKETRTETPYWHWARLLGRVFDLDMATCPLCHRAHCASLPSSLMSR